MKMHIYSSKHRHSSQKNCQELVVPCENGFDIIYEWNSLIERNICMIKYVNKWEFYFRRGDSQGRTSFAQSIQYSLSVRHTKSSLMFKLLWMNNEQSITRTIKTTATTSGKRQAANKAMMQNAKIPLINYPLKWHVNWIKIQLFDDSRRSFVGFLLGFLLLIEW